MMKVTLFVLSLGLPVINFIWISPALWSHNSSAAFEMWVVFWLVSIVVPISVLFLPSGDSRP